jgi:hypothetical protein
MTPGGTVKLKKPMGTPEWIFRWRGSRQPFFPRLFALALVGGAFAFLVMMVKIRVDAPQKSSPRKASLIYLTDDAQGRALTLRAQQGGPFPSRFVLSQWDGLAELEKVAMEAARFQPPPYVPQLPDLPAERAVQPLELAARGEAFFPQRATAPAVIPDVGQWQLVPVLYPLAGVTAEALPEKLPPFGAVVDAGMSAVSWRFLVRLNPDGSVAECVSLEKGDEEGAPELEAWLRKIPFQPALATPFRWISVGIGFTNQPADGTHAR